MMRTFAVADLFCGAGGSSSGAVKAIRNIGGEMDLVAVNHWATAIATHTRNHPTARHYHVDLDAARPEEIVPEGRLDLLMASPECTYFSRARGGKPISDQKRMSAWHVQRWATTLDVRCILVENVPEFQFWGPLLANGRPDPARRGLYFQGWIQSLWALGYAVDWKLINAADYGDATTRTRFFLQARKDGRAIRWPAATHSPDGASDLLGERRRWRAAREIIDWSNPGRSILNRKKALSEKTRRRIARGLQRFGGPLAPLYIALLDLADVPTEASAGSGQPQPFVFANRGNATAKDIEGPIPTITTLRGWNVGVVEPIVEPFTFGNRNHAVPKGADEPIPTATTSTGGGVALVEPTVTPFVLGQQSGSVARSTSDPIPTVAASGAIALIDPSLVPYYGWAETTQTVDAPLPTVTSKPHYGLCAPVVVPYGPRAEARPDSEPLPTILTKDRLGVASPMIVPFYGEKNGQPRSPRSCEEPLATITAEPRFGVCMPEVEPFVLSRFGEFDPASTPRAHSIDRPLPTVTGSGAGYVVTPFLVPQFGERDGQVPRVHDLGEPLPAVTSHGAGALVRPTIDVADGEEVDPRRLVVVDGVLCLLDIRFRMLTNRELARAMGFDDDEIYDFAGTTEEVTRQIGNAVAVNTAAALVRAILGEGEGESGR